MRRNWIVVLLFAVVASSGCATAYAHSGRAAYVGRWAEIPAKQCQDSAYEFTMQGVDTGMEGSCRFDQISGGSGRWHVTMTCRGEGGSHREQWEILVKGKSLQIKSHGEITTKLTRCP
jgi:hypothetical protein